VPLAVWVLVHSILAAYVENVTAKELAGTKNQLIFVPSGGKRKMLKGW
jgi:hypothetical protein